PSECRYLSYHFEGFYHDQGLRCIAPDQAIHDVLNLRTKLFRQKGVQRHFEMRVLNNFLAQLLIHYMPVPKGGSVRAVHVPEKRLSQTVPAGPCLARNRDERVKPARKVALTCGSSVFAYCRDVSVQLVQWIHTQFLPDRGVTGIGVRLG